MDGSQNTYLTRKIYINFSINVDGSQFKECENLKRNKCEFTFAHLLGKARCITIRNGIPMTRAETMLFDFQTERGDLVANDEDFIKFCISSPQDRNCMINLSANVQQHQNDESKCNETVLWIEEKKHNCVVSVVETQMDVDKSHQLLQDLLKSKLNCQSVGVIDESKVEYNSKCFEIGLKLLKLSLQRHGDDDQLQPETKANLNTCTNNQKSLGVAESIFKLLDMINSVQTIANNNNNHPSCEPNTNVNEFEEKATEAPLMSIVVDECPSS